MGTCNIRFGSTLTFDDVTEKDIISVLEHLNSTHSMGKFMSNLIRVALDNPDILDKTTHPVEKGALLKKIEEVNISCNRKKFFNDINKSIDDMRKKVDKIYEMSLKNYTLAQMGKHLGLESKANNTMLAGFILEKQLKELQDVLGFAPGTAVFASNRLDDVHKRADDTLEYIIETYDSIINDLKAQFEVQKIEIPVQQIVSNNIIEERSVEEKVETVESEIQTSEIAENKSEVTDNIEDEPVDFGGADFDALDFFFSNRSGE